MSFDEEFARLRRQFEADPSNPRLVRQLTQAFERSGQTLRGRSLSTWRQFLTGDNTLKKAMALDALSNEPWAGLSVLPTITTMACESENFLDRAQANMSLIKLGPLAASAKAQILSFLETKKPWPFMAYRDLFKVLLAIDKDHEGLIQWILKAGDSQSLRSGLYALHDLEFDWQNHGEALIQVLESEDVSSRTRIDTSSLILSVSSLSQDLSERLSRCLSDSEMIVRVNVVRFFLTATDCQQHLSFDWIFESFTQASSDMLFTHLYQLLQGVASPAQREIMRDWHGQYYEQARMFRSSAEAREAVQILKARLVAL